MQSQQLPTESQVLEDEVLPGTENADQPTEEMSERRDHRRNYIGKVRIELCAKSFILQVYDVLARYNCQEPFRLPDYTGVGSPTPFLGIVSPRGCLMFRCTRGSNGPVERTGAEARCQIYQSLDSETPLGSGESTRTACDGVNFRNADDTGRRRRFT